MNTYLCVFFCSRFPPPDCAIVIAEDEEEAKRLIRKEVGDRNLGQLNQPLELVVLTHDTKGITLFGL